MKITYALLALLAGCATSVPYQNSTPVTSNIDPVVAKAMTTVCAPLPLQAAGGADSTGTWTSFLDNSCGGTGYIAGGTMPSGAIPAAAPPQGMPVLRLPGLTKTTPGEINYVADFVNEDGATRNISWRIIPKDYFGTAYGYDATYPWNPAVISAKTRLVIRDTGKASSQIASVRLELAVPPGTKIGGFSGAVRLP